MLIFGAFKNLKTTRLGKSRRKEPCFSIWGVDFLHFSREPHVRVYRSARVNFDIGEQNTVTTGSGSELSWVNHQLTHNTSNGPGTMAGLSRSARVLLPYVGFY